MAIMNAKLNPTLADFTSRVTPGGGIDPDIIEVLTETNEMLQDITVQEANGVTEHTTTVRTGLPTVAWKKLNYGTKPSKSTTKQVKDTMGKLEAWAEVDYDLAVLNGMDAGWRFSEEVAFIEAMNQTFQRALIYGDNKTEPEQILGLTARFPTGDKKKADCAVNVLNAGGTATTGAGKETGLTSVWLVGWSPQTVFCTYPKGSKAGLSSEDKGKTTKDNAEDGLLDVLRTKYTWNVGMVVRDWRYVVRIANIHQDALGDDPAVAGTVDLFKYLRMARNRLPNRNGGVARLAFYANRTVIDALEGQAENKKNVRLTVKEIKEGNTVTSYLGIPLRVVDALGFNEKQVTGFNA